MSGEYPAPWAPPRQALRAVHRPGWSSLSRTPRPGARYRARRSRRRARASERCRRAHPPAPGRQSPRGAAEERRRSRDRRQCARGPGSATARRAAPSATPRGAVPRAGAGRARAAPQAGAGAGEAAPRRADRGVVGPDDAEAAAWSAGLNSPRVGGRIHACSRCSGRSGIGTPLCCPADINLHGVRPGYDPLTSETGS